MIGDRTNVVLRQMLENIELPEQAYITAEKRYKDIGEWLHRPESTCVKYEPHVFSQGSFRLGTAIKPDSGDEYDLDMGSELCKGLSKKTVSQEQLKNLIGAELELYRKARGIKEDLKEKRRCWRLEYADGLSFHMDIVPCIPEDAINQGLLKARMVEVAQLDEVLANDVSRLAVSITDNEDTGYRNITDDWRISNPEGYARWFEARMKTAAKYLAEREMKVQASIDTLPYYQWKTPLQMAIQLLKRHRDVMYKGNEDSKPISIIITTLAAKAYRGEGDLASALKNILDTMDSYINVNVPLVPNPVNPAEDFADKWYSKDHVPLKLRENFYKWLYQAKADYAAICSKDNSQIIVDAAERGFDISLNRNSIEQALGLSAAVFTPRNIEASNPKPWFEL